MDIADFERRFEALFSNMIVLDEKGEPTLTPEFEPLHQDITQALKLNEASEELQEMAQSLNAMKAHLSDPDIAKGMYQSLTTPVARNPAIYDAIDDLDFDAIRLALKDCDINQRHGEYQSTALYHAMSSSFAFSLEMIDFLLDAGADPRLGLSQTNVLHGLGFAVMKGIAPEDLATRIRRCIDLGADIEERSDKLKWTPLILAASEWNPVATEALLMAGADITARAGEVDGVCFAGSDAMAFADGHPETMDVLKRYATAN